MCIQPAAGGYTEVTMVFEVPGVFCLPPAFISEKRPGTAEASSCKPPFLCRRWLQLPLWCVAFSFLRRPELLARC